MNLLEVVGLSCLFIGTIVCGAAMWRLSHHRRRPGQLRFGLSFVVLGLAGTMYGWEQQILGAAALALYILAFGLTVPAPSRVSQH